MKLSANAPRVSPNRTPQVAKQPEKTESSDKSLGDHFVTFGLGATPGVGALMNGTVAVMGGFAEMIGARDIGFGRNVAGTLANIGGTAALTAGLVAGALPITIAGAALLAGSGLALAL